MSNYLECLLGGVRPVDLRTVAFPPDLTALVLGPHPDDFDAVAVTLSLLRDNGNPLFAAVVRSGSGVEDSYASPPTLEQKAAVREREQRNSCAAFGLPESALAFLDLQQDAGGQLLENPANREALRRHLIEVHPDLLFLPHGADTNAGHRRLYAMARTIAAEAGWPLAAFFNRDPKTTRIRVDAFTGFDDAAADWKRRLLLCHDSQHRRNLNARRIGFDERILDFNRRTAREIPGAGPYAETFEIEFFSPVPPEAAAAPPEEQPAVRASDSPTDPAAGPAARRQPP